MTTGLASAFDAFASSWWAWCVPAAWHATWFALVGLVLERVLRERLAPAYRAIPWWLFFACFALPPGVVSPFASGVREFASPAVLAETLASAQPAGADATSTWPLAGLAAVVWLTGVLVCVARLVHGRRKGLAELHARSFRAPRSARRRLASLLAAAGHGPHARIELAVTPGLASPLLAGIVHRTIHVPERLLGRPHELEHALRHELAHCERHDPLRALAVELCAALVWFHPLTRVAVRRLGQARELACDARVARTLGRDASATADRALDGYRATLARAALERDATRRALAAGFAASGRLAGAQEFLGRARIVERLRALERPPRFAPGWHALVASLLFACASATLLPAGRSAERAFAERVLAAADSGEKLSCFTLHAAALALRDELPSPDSASPLSPSPAPTE
ncbi:MAG: M56 family metallopeptidase [Planctomycetes bacterium]|nr:M56 family metallopeptidase [Planctomycetota bacterium]